MKLPSGFVDGFGVEYSDGEVVPTDISVSAQQNRTVRYFDGSYVSDFNSKHCFVNFRALVFVTPDAKTSKKRPLSFVLPDGRENFSFEIPFEDIPQTDEDLLSRCEAYLASILNPQ